jgi:glycosyltransferase involved in cell wall biosynthesis
MRIGIVIYGNPDHYPPTVNAIHQLHADHSVTVVARNTTGPARDYPAGVVIHRLGPLSSSADRQAAPPLSKIAEFFAFVRASRALLRRTDRLLAYDAYGLVAATHIRASRPLVYHNHEICYELPPLRTLGGWIHRLERRYAREADLVVFPDQERADLFESLARLPRRPLIVPNVPLASMYPRPDWDEVFPRRAARPALLYRGTISPEAALHEVLAATARLPVQLVLVGFLGSGITPDQLVEEAARHGVEDRFRYLGVLPYPELRPVTESAAVGLALYRGSTFDRAASATAANKIFEYAACGLPVVVSDLPGYRHAFASERWVAFADPSDPSSIASAVAKLLGHEQEYRVTCRDARRAFEERYNFETAFAPVSTWFRQPR